MLAVFLWPSVVKLEHHHDHCEEHSCCGASVEKEHEKCEICTFEFSVFTDEAEDPIFADERILTVGLVPNLVRKCADHDGYIFLLRAPPHSHC